MSSKRYIDAGEAMAKDIAINCLCDDLSVPGVGADIAELIRLNVDEATARIVAWLRTGDADLQLGKGNILHDLADAIERGDYNG